MFTTIGLRVRGEVGLGDTNRRDARWGRDTNGDEGRRERVGRGVYAAWGMVGRGRLRGGWVDGGSPQHEGRGEGFVAMAGGDDDGGGLAQCSWRSRRCADPGAGGRWAEIIHIRAGGDQAADHGPTTTSTPRVRTRPRSSAAAAATTTSPLLRSPDVLPKSKPTLVGWAGIEDGNVRDESSPAGDSPLADVKEDHPDAIPRSWWIVGLAVTGAWTASVLHLNFGMALWQPILALPVAAVMSYVAVRCTGETDINPIGPMGKIIQLVFALVAPGAIVTNLMAAAVACGGAGQAGDLMHDFRAGLMMRLSPRKQLLAQLAGIPIGILGAVPTYALFAATYPIGGEQFPAPAAMAARGRGGADRAGGGGLPAEAKPLMAAAALFTAWVRTVERAAETRAELNPNPRAARWIKRLMISPTSAGIAFIIPPEFSTTIAVRGHLFGVLGAAGQGAPRGSRVHSGERVVGRGWGDGGGHRAGVHGVRDHRAGNVRCARVDVSVRC